MDLDALGKFISTVGFPVAVAGGLIYVLVRYLLTIVTRINGKLDKLSDTTSTNNALLADNSTKVAANTASNIQLANRIERFLEKVERGHLQ